ncbi:MAG: hypothetical protein COA90_10080 [Gammaproteobacteria bacterium]|nr:MAG: hypothetical protein COA90_10080 [Gammaproteobacteria bacterium]
MDFAEKHVLKHLHSCKFSSIEYEPNGNVPPDFLVNGKIAIEVRRLNQNHFTRDGVKGLEETAIPLWQKVKRLVENFSQPLNGESWFVYFSFSRPVSNWKNLKPLLQKALKQFSETENKKPTVLISKGGLELEVFAKASKSHSTMLLMGAYSDEQSGGLLIAEMEKNITHCIEEKTSKISAFKSNYDEWWLVLVDHIGHGLDAFDRKQFHEHVSIDHSWDRVIIIDPLDENNWFEMK